MKQVFIVNEVDDNKIVSKGILIKDIMKSLPENIHFKQKDIDMYADEMISQLSGQAIDFEDYKRMLMIANDALIDYTTITPYKLSVLRREYNKLVEKVQYTVE